MSCWIRKVSDGKAENHTLLAEDSWDLRTNVEAFESWIREHDGALEAGDHWIADIGFNVRLDANGGGPILCLELLTLCVRNRVEVYLSEYGVDEWLLRQLRAKRRRKD